MRILVLFLGFFGFFAVPFAGPIGSPFARADECPHMHLYDPAMQMCMPVAMQSMPMSMLMLSGNSFFTGLTESGPRGTNTFAVPNYMMLDVGTSIGESQYLNLNFMGTLERWTLPDRGYPELLQIGEANKEGVAYLDAQHPHSSPVMGLTLSDTFTLDRNLHARIFFAPRGEATDGPVSFMHRTTAQSNPDAPLGHHIGQDVGHITSTVLGTSVKVDKTNFEFSTYHGAEPSPQSVDLPISNFNSYSFRIAQEFLSRMNFMISYAYVDAPEPFSPHADRYSASLYYNGEHFQNSLIWGSITNYDGASLLTSFTEEFKIDSIWGRLEVLQRTPAELEISNSNAGVWVSAWTAGYTKNLGRWRKTDFNLGASLTLDVLPQIYRDTYGGDPVTAKIFLQVSGSAMWNLISAEP